MTIGPGSEQNPYTAELEAVATGLRAIPPPSHFPQEVTVVVGNRSVVAAIGDLSKNLRNALNEGGIYDQTKRL